MYSIVLMMALSAGTQAPAGHNKCCGCSSCYSCCGCYSCCSCSCSGKSHGHHKSCCCGCYSCYSCCGGYYGCCGGCCGGYYGCCGGYYGCCGGCCGGYGAVDAGGAGVIMGGPGATGDAGRSGTTGGDKKREEIKKPKGEKEEASTPAPATIIVSLPAEARLLIDGVATKSTTSTRVFASPALEQGKDFSYTLKAELNRDGKTVTATKRVAVRAGAETRVAIDFPEASLAQK